MEMDRTSGKGTYITQMSRTSREVDRTRKCIVWKSIVPDGKELGQKSKAQARLPSAILVFFFFCGFSSASRLHFKSSIV